MRFKAIASVPSFELWLLLHYEDIRAPMRRLRLHLPGYEKGAGQVFTLTRDRLGVATQRAQALVAKFSAYDAPNPYTGIGGLGWPC
jgi:hypothetical protein